MQPGPPYYWTPLCEREINFYLFKLLSVCFISGFLLPTVEPNPATPGITKLWYMGGTGIVIYPRKHIKTPII